LEVATADMTVDWTAGLIAKDFPDFPIHYFNGKHSESAKMRYWTEDQCKIALRWSWERSQDRLKLAESHQAYVWAGGGKAERTQEMTVTFSCLCTLRFLI
jgi:hypothetical protein